MSMFGFGCIGIARRCIAGFPLAALYHHGYLD